MRVRECVRCRESLGWGRHRHVGRGRSGDGEGQDRSGDTDDSSCRVGAGRGESTRERIGLVQETLYGSAGWKGGMDRLEREPCTGEDGEAPRQTPISFFKGVLPTCSLPGLGRLLALGPLGHAVHGGMFRCISGVYPSDTKPEQTCLQTLSNVP